LQAKAQMSVRRSTGLLFGCSGLIWAAARAQHLRPATWALRLRLEARVPSPGHLLTTCLFNNIPGFRFYLISSFDSSV
jgi:hypothetical protein